MIHSIPKDWRCYRKGWCSSKMTASIIGSFSHGSAYDIACYIWILNSWLLLSVEKHWSIEQFLEWHDFQLIYFGKWPGNQPQIHIYLIQQPAVHSSRNVSAHIITRNVCGMVFCWVELYCVNCWINKSLLNGRTVVQWLELSPHLTLQQEDPEFESSD